MKTQYEYASLKVRLAGMVYEGLLLSAVTFVALAVAALFALLLRELPQLRTAVTGMILILSWHWYFVGAWRKKEQTLAMKTWRIVLKSANGSRANRKQLSLRFIWACVFLLLLPSLVYMAARHYGYVPSVAVILAVLWWILPFGWATINRERQFLYDFLAGTALFRVSKTE